MVICFPVIRQDGLNSVLYNHFGSAKSFLLYDTVTQTYHFTSNDNATHHAGGCQPLKALGATLPETIIVCGIGTGALGNLMRSGITVLRAQGETVAENLDLLQRDALQPFATTHTCSGHEHHAEGHGEQSQHSHGCCGHH